jgi:membrane-bound lytic murein transglycosylase D
VVDERDRIYVVKKGDTLTSIAERFNVPLSALIIWNRLDPKARLQPGDQLLIHSKPAEIDKDVDKSRNSLSKTE